jgi:hypothetical protein
MVGSQFTPSFAGIDVLAPMLTGRRDFFHLRERRASETMTPSAELARSR